MPLLTPGRVTSLWVVLNTLRNFGGRAATEEVVTYASRSSLRSGGLPIPDGLRLGLQGRFLRELGSDIEIAPLGSEALSLCSDDEPTLEVRRLILSVVMLKDPPNWVAFWQGDPANIDILMSDLDREMLQGAGLYPRDRTDFVAESWWNALSVVPLPEKSAAIRKAIGDAGEQMSIKFERRRLTREGYPELARQVWWAANESAAYGFDIGSFAGSSFGFSPDTRIAIEVKSVGYPTADCFPLHLTIHEYQTAQYWANRHMFHLWQAVRIPPSINAATEAPRIATLDPLAAHLSLAPTCGGRCRWDSMYIEFPLKDCLDQAQAKHDRRRHSRSGRP